MSVNFFHVITPRHQVFDRLLDAEHIGLSNVYLLGEEKDKPFSFKKLLLQNFNPDDVRIKYQIGRAVTGLKFTFRGYKGVIESLDELKSILSLGGDIEDENHRSYSINTFLCAVQGSQKGMSHQAYIQKHQYELLNDDWQYDGQKNFFLMTAFE